MIKAALRGEFDYYQRNRLLPAGKFIPIDEEVVRAMLEAALKALEPKTAEKATDKATEKLIEKATDKPAKKPTIITARAPRKRR